MEKSTPRKRTQTSSRADATAPSCSSAVVVDVPPMAVTRRTLARACMAVLAGHPDAAAQQVGRRADSWQPWSGHPVARSAQQLLAEVRRAEEFVNGAARRPVVICGRRRRCSCASPQWFAFGAVRLWGWVAHASVGTKP